MHIVVFEHDFYPNLSGSSLVRWRFCQLAIRRGHEVTVFTHRTGDLPRSETIDGVRILRPLGLKPADLPGTTALAITLEFLTTMLLLPFATYWFLRHDIDGIHATAHDMFWISKVLSVLFRIPCVTFVGYTPSLRTEDSRFFELLLERVNFRLFMGHTVYCRVPAIGDILRKMTNGSVGQIHGVVNQGNVIDAAKDANVQEIRSRWDVAPEETLLVFVGRLAPKKNPLRALDVLESLPESYILVVVGDGVLKEDLREEVAQRDLGGRVHMMGNLPHEETLQLTYATDATLLTSDVEAYPTVAFEGLSLGNTVFATPVGILPEIDHPDLVVEGLTELADTIRRTVLEDSHYVDEDALKQFAIEVYVDRILEEFDTLISD